MPKVSIIIPTHQRAQMVAEAIESVLLQSYQDFEILVVDDSSTDNTRSVLEPYVKNNLVKYYYIEAKSAAAARNLGLVHANGDFIAFLDDDDIWNPEKLKMQVLHFQQHPDTGLAHGGFSKFNQAGQDLGYRDASKLSGNVYPKLLSTWSTLIMISTVMVPSYIIREVGPFVLGLPGAEDLELWARISKSYPVHGISQELAKVREHIGNISGDKISRPENFIRYLKTCFLNDPNLSTTDQRRILSRMYGNSGINLLGEGDKYQMKIARKYSIKSLSFRWFQLEAYFNLAISILPFSLRNRLFGIWQSLRYNSFHE